MRNENKVGVFKFIVRQTPMLLVWQKEAFKYSSYG